MYRTYKPEIIEKENNFEERLIPREVKEIPVNICTQSKNLSPINDIFGGFFGNIGWDDILIIALLILLFYENCDDNILITILVVLLFTGI